MKDPLVLPDGEPSQGTPSTMIPVLPLAALPPASRTTVEAAGRKIALFHVDGQIYATGDACKDQGYSLGTFGTLEGHRIVCGLHFWEYDVRTGASTDGMDEQLEVFRTEIRDGQIWIETPPELPCGRASCEDR